MAKLLFWLSVAFVAYVYIGYPLLIGCLAWIGPRKTLQSQVSDSDLPRVTVVIPAHNEERWIERKIENTFALDYPRDGMEILVASDGSTDRTVEIVRQFASSGVRLIHYPERAGKVATLNRTVGGIKNDIVVFTDANAILRPDALRCVLAHFSDPDVGCAGGTRLCLATDSTSTEGESIYWRYEGWIRSCESVFYSALGCYGQIFAVRRRLFPYIQTVSDDFPIAMKILIYSGARTVFEPRAKALIPAARTLRQELERKIRSHVAFLYDIKHLKKGLNPLTSKICWQFWSHHVFRVLVPFAMLAAIVVSPWLWNADWGGWLAFFGQILFYLLALVGFLQARRGIRWKPAYLCFYFAFANVAMVMAWVRRVRGGQFHTWQRTERVIPQIPNAAD